MPRDGRDEGGGVAVAEPRSMAERDQRVGQMLREVFDGDDDTDGSLYIARHGPGEVVVQFIGDAGRRLQAFRDDLFTAIRVMLRREPQKRCRGGLCVKAGGENGQMVPICQFGRNQKEPDGRNRRCRKCECARIAQWEARRALENGRRRTRG